MRRRSTIRWRLTLLFGLLFMMCGALVLTTSYLIVRGSLTQDEEARSQRVIEEYGYTRQSIDLVLDFPVPPPETGRDAETVGDVITGIQSGITADALRQLLIGSGVALVVMVGLSIWCGWIAAGRALRPVGSLTARAQSLSEDNLHERLALEGPQDELKELADTLDGMISRLDEAFCAQRAFASYVSHELRTPLAIMRAEADLALSGDDATAREQALAASVRDATDRSEALLDSLLALARSESTMGERTVVDVAELAGDVVSDRIDRADAAGVRLELELGDSVDVEGDRWLLERLVANLVDNGVTHNVVGGWLSVTVERRGDRAVVRTSNTGDHLTPEQVRAILEPFQRVSDGRRPGYGLGMTIVCSVAKAHGGNVDLFPRPEGGLDVEVSLPLASGRAGGVEPSRRPATSPARDGAAAAPIDPAAPAAPIDLRLDPHELTR